MNNKGFTVVELIVSFSIASLVMLGLFEIVDSYRTFEQNEGNIRLINNYRNEIIVNITEKLKNAISIEGEDIRVTSLCSGFQQAIKIEYKDNTKYLCVGGKVTGSNSGNSGIMFVEEANMKYFYPSPSKNIDFVDDIIINSSPSEEELAIFNVDGKTMTEKFYNIYFSLKHTELDEKYLVKIPVISRTIS